MSMSGQFFLGHIPRSSMSVGMRTESPRLGLRRDSNRTIHSVVCLLCLLCIFCSVFLDCQSFKLTLHQPRAPLTFYPYILSLLSKLSFVQEGPPATNHKLSFSPSLTNPVFRLLSSSPIHNHIEWWPLVLVFDIRVTFAHRRKRKGKQQRCSPSNLTIHLTTYLINTSTWIPQMPMATKKSHFPAATWISSSLSIRYLVTVAISRPLVPPPNALVSLLSPGAKTSGACRRIPQHHRLVSREAFLFMTLFSLPLFQTSA